MTYAVSSPPRLHVHIVVDAAKPVFESWEGGSPVATPVLTATVISNVEVQSMDLVLLSLHN